jgi:hypothetical protein
MFCFVNRGPHEDGTTIQGAIHRKMFVSRLPVPIRAHRLANGATGDAGKTGPIYEAEHNQSYSP